MRSSKPRMRPSSDEHCVGTCDPQGEATLIRQFDKKIYEEFEFARMLLVRVLRGFNRQKGAFKQPVAKFAACDLNISFGSLHWVE